MKREFRARKNWRLFPSDKPDLIVLGRGFLPGLFLTRAIPSLRSLHNPEKQTLSAQFEGFSSDDISKRKYKNRIESPFAICYEDTTVLKDGIRDLHNRVKRVSRYASSRK
jgi:hypothetical protein